MKQRCTAGCVIIVTSLLGVATGAPHQTSNYTLDKGETTKRFSETCFLCLETYLIVEKCSQYSTGSGAALFASKSFKVRLVLLTDQRI